MAENVEVWRLFALPDGTSSMERINVRLEGGRSRLLSGTGVQVVSMTPNNEPGLARGAAATTDRHDRRRG